MRYHRAHGYLSAVFSMQIRHGNIGINVRDPTIDSICIHGYHSWLMRPTYCRSYLSVLIIKALSVWEYSNQFCEIHNQLHLHLYSISQVLSTLMSVDPLSHSISMIFYIDLL
jgi:hypothetical protein